MHVLWNIFVAVLGSSLHLLVSIVYAITGICRNLRPLSGFDLYTTTCDFGGENYK